MPLEPDTRREVDSDPCCHRHIVLVILVWQKQMDILLGFWHLCIATFLRKAPLTYPEEPSLKVEEDEDIFVERLLNWGLGMRIERLFLGIPGTWEMCFPGKS